MERKKVITSSDVKQRQKRLADAIIAENNPGSGNSRNNARRPDINLNAVRGVGQQNGAAKVASKIILESNPQLTRALEIMSGLIVSPNGGAKVVLSTTCDAPDDLVNADVREIVRAYIEDAIKEDKMASTLQQQVFDILSVNGADVEVYIPDAARESLMEKQGLESFRSAVGEAGHAAEALEKGIKVDTDLGILAKSIIHSQKATLRVGLEAAKGNEKINVSRLLEKRRLIKEAPQLMLEQSDVAKSVARTIRKTLPPEAVIPYVMKGDKYNPRGYVVLLDEDGYPIHVDEQIDFDRELRSGNREEMNTALVNIASDFGMTANKYNKSASPKSLFKNIYKDFTNMLEKKMFESLDDGTYHEKYTLEDDNFLAEIMFFRMLRKKKTRLLFVPPQLISYMAFYRNSAGVGESLVSRIKLLSTLQSALFYAHFMGELDNAIPKQRIDVTLDNEDYDQTRTQEQIANEIMQSKAGSLDWDWQGPSDLMENIQRSGMHFNFSGMEAGDAVNMEVRTEDYKREKREMNQDFLKWLGELISMKTGISHQWVADSYTPQFSSEVIRENELTARQIQSLVEILQAAVTDRAIKRVINDPVRVEELLEAIKDKAKRASPEELEIILENALAYTEVNLPEPEQAGLEMNKEAVESKKEILEIVMEAVLPDVLTDSVETLDVPQLRSLRELLVSHFLKRYITKDTMFADVVNELNNDEAVKELFEGRLGDLTRIIKHLGDFAGKWEKTDFKLSEKLEKKRSRIGEPEPEPDPVTDPEPTPTEDDDLPAVPGEDEIPDGPEAEPGDEPVGGDVIDDLPPLPEE